MTSERKTFFSSKVMENVSINETVFGLALNYKGLRLKAGQFFMIKPKRSSVFLGRPISVAGWDQHNIFFLIAKRGKGTEELSELKIGEKVNLLGPLGNSWSDFLVNEYPIALVSGGIGIAPLFSFAEELGNSPYDFYAGFKSTPFGIHKLHPNSSTVVSEDGSTGKKGFITDFIKPENYKAVYACGPEAMLKTLSVLCKKVNVPLFISIEKYMACGVGACLGCTVKTVSGNQRCCVDGAIFKADEVIFDE